MMDPEEKIILKSGLSILKRALDPEGEHDSHKAADKADQNGLDQELGEDVAAARADGHTNSDLLGALGHRHKHDIHHADAKPLPGHNLFGVSCKKAVACPAIR